jgi:hypothetical protein
MQGRTKLEISYQSAIDAIANYLRDHVFGEGVAFEVKEVKQIAVGGPYSSGCRFEIEIEHPAPTDGGTGT